MDKYFAPDYELDVRPSNMDNANTRDYLDKIRTQVIENLKRTAFAPSVQMTDVPRDPLVGGMNDEAEAILDDLDEDENADKRFTKRRFDQYVEKPGELSESEDEEMHAANGIRRQPGVPRRRNQINYRNVSAPDSGLDSGMATPQDASSVADDERDARDAKMTEAPEGDFEEEELPPSRATPVKVGQEATGEASEMAVDGEEQAVSTAISRQPSPATRDEDTTMEDAAAPGPEGVAHEAGAEQPQSEREPEKPSVPEDVVAERQLPTKPEFRAELGEGGSAEQGVEAAKIEEGSHPSKVDETPAADSELKASENTSKAED